MHKHPKTSSEALHPSDFKGDKSGSSNAGRQGAYGQSSKGPLNVERKIPAFGLGYMRGATGKLGN